MFRIEDFLDSTFLGAENLLYLIGCGSVTTREEGPLGEFTLYGQLANHKHVRITYLKEDVIPSDIRQDLGHQHTLELNTAKPFLAMHFNVELGIYYRVTDIFRTDTTIVVLVKHIDLDQSYAISLYTYSQNLIYTAI